jgi:hypothetical protein
MKKSQNGDYITFAALHLLANSIACHLLFRWKAKMFLVMFVLTFLAGPWVGPLIVALDNDTTCVRTRYETATRMCKERQVMNSNAPREVSRPSPSKSKSSPAPRPKSAKASDGYAIRPEKLYSKGQEAAHRRDTFLPLDVGKTVQRSALSRLQSGPSRLESTASARLPRSFWGPNSNGDDRGC